MEMVKQDIPTLELTAMNPANGQTLGSLPYTQAHQIPEMFSQARKAQAVWAEKSFSERRQHMKKMGNYIRDNADELARIVSESNGKTRMDALATEVLPCLMACDWYGKNAASVLKPEYRGPSSLLWIGKRSEIRQDPLGVVGIVSPWNYPLSIPFGEVVMGLMAGNAIILKVAAATPLVGRAIEDIVAAAELPDGLFHHIVGSGGQVSSAMFENGIDKLFFTGSVPTGKQIMAQAAATLTPVSLELGGKDPMIVLDDADLERAANGAAWAGYQNAGQSCGGVERVYVHEAVYHRFVELMAEKTKALRHGVPDNKCSVDIGSMTTAKQRQFVEGQLADAVRDGAKIVAQSQATSDQDGEFHPATLVTDVHHDMALMREETFGPVIPVMSFKTEDEAVALANDCTMALTASIWTRNTKRGKILADRINGGVVAINDHLYTHGMSDLPWGGPGESGIGRTHGPEGLLEMTHSKVVNWDWLKAKRNLWWYPQDEASNNAIHNALHLVAPRSPVDFVRASLRVMPAMIRKMYF
ncbi:MAG: aldehyde dehydrogenase family protein [Marinobacter sp.]